MVLPAMPFCWKQVRLGKGSPDVQQKGIAGNTILFAQPTANIPSMELPPAHDALLDSLNVVFSGKAHDLSKAYWATVKRSEYMKIVQERKRQCATFAEVSIREDLAETRLPEHGVPEHVQACLQPVDGVDRAPVRMLGPASRAPEVGRDEEAGEESEQEQEPEEDAKATEQPDLSYLHENVAETTVAVDPVHHVGPVRMMQALQGTLRAIQQHASRIAKNETTPTVADSSGALQPVADEGGRHAMRSMVLDVQSAARSLDERAQVELETAQARADTCRMVTPQSLSVPTQKPISAFDSRSWPACYTEFWFGDGAPNLERDRPMLFEQVARRLINVEELEYSMPSDEEPYQAACQSRFSSPEIVAVLGDVVRRLRLLKGTRAAVGRRGFGADLQTLADASAEDFMEALNIAKPSDCIVSAMPRPGMPAKVKSALRTLLLSTSDVPGTEGRKTALRFDGHANNLKFGAASFFATPNFADTYSPLVLQLHEGPDKNIRVDLRWETDGESRRGRSGEGRGTGRGPGSGRGTGRETRVSMEPASTL